MRIPEKAKTLILTSGIILFLTGVYLAVTEVVNMPYDIRVRIGVFALIANLLAFVVDFLAFLLCLLYYFLPSPKKTLSFFWAMPIVLFLMELIRALVNGFFCKREGGSMWASVWTGAFLVALALFLYGWAMWICLHQKKGDVDANSTKEGDASL